MCWLMHLAQERSSPGDGSSTGVSDGAPAAAGLHAGDQGGDLLGFETAASGDSSADAPQQRELASHPLASLI